MARRKNAAAADQEEPEFGKLYRFIRNAAAPKARSLWLATATPMQIDMVEVCDLIALTNRVGGFQYEPMLTSFYYRIVEKLVSNQEVSAQEWEFLWRAVATTEQLDKVLWQFSRDFVTTGLTRQSFDRWLRSPGQVVGERDRTRLLRPIAGLSPLARVMMRHTRKLLEVYRDKGQLSDNLATRNVLPTETIKFSDTEAQMYQHLNTYCEGLMQKLGRSAKTRTSVQFLQSFFRLRFASSVYAYRLTLERRLDKVERTLQYMDAEMSKTGPEEEELEEAISELEVETDNIVTEAVFSNRKPADLRWERDELHAMLQEVPKGFVSSSKMTKLLEGLDGRYTPATGRVKQTVIFTRFFDTLEYIVSMLQRRIPNVRVGTYSGDLISWFDPDLNQMVRNADREEVKERFLRGEIDVLVCTDAAAEGLNLQTADLLVNFDLGWNPMKIEQRIGRIDRIGQKHDVIHVLNLCYAGSEEEIVYKRLLERLSQASIVVGAQQRSLMPVTPDEFRKLATGELNIDELVKIVEQRIKEEDTRSQTMELAPKEIYDIYSRLSQAYRQTPSPISLDEIWMTLSRSPWLKSLGAKTAQFGDEHGMVVSGIPGAPTEAILTVSRQLYEEGAAEITQKIHFASYGDPYFDAIVNHDELLDLPSCISRISVPISGIPGAEVVGYAVAGVTKSGNSSVHLVCSLRDVEEVGELDAGREISESEIAPLRQRLVDVAQEITQNVARSEETLRANRQVAHLHEWFDLVVAYNLLDEKAGGRSKKFSRVMHQAEVSLSGRENLMIAGVPTDELKPMKDFLLFDCAFPNNKTVLLPNVAIRTGLTVARRAASGTGKAVRELDVKTVLDRLKRQAETAKRGIR